MNPEFHPPELGRERPAVESRPPLTLTNQDVWACAPSILKELIPASGRLGVFTKNQQSSEVTFVVVNEEESAPVEEFEQDFHIIELGNYRDVFSDDIELSGGVLKRPLMAGKLIQERHDLVVVAQFEVAAPLQGKGVGSEFYQRLEEVARSRGNRFLVGLNTRDESLGFYFSKAQGRYSFPALKDEKRQEILAYFPEDMWVTLEGNGSIKFLRKEDIAKYVRG